jgi:hypothetical protein
MEAGKFGGYARNLSPMLREHRTAPRHRVLKAGSISCGAELIDCTVRNISDIGAALEVVTPLYIPDRFKLIIESSGFNRPCHIIWRQQRRIGVAFDYLAGSAGLIKRD